MDTFEEQPLGGTGRRRHYGTLTATALVGLAARSGGQLCLPVELPDGLIDRGRLAEVRTLYCRGAEAA